MSGALTEWLVTVMSPHLPSGRGGTVLQAQGLCHQLRLGWPLRGHHAARRTRADGRALRRHRRPESGTSVAAESFLGGGGWRQWVSGLEVVVERPIAGTRSASGRAWASGIAIGWWGGLTSMAICRSVPSTSTPPLPCTETWSRCWRALSRMRTPWGRYSRGLQPATVTSERSP